MISFPLLGFAPRAMPQYNSVLTLIFSRMYSVWLGTDFPEWLISQSPQAILLRGGNTVFNFLRKHIMRINSNFFIYLLKWITNEMNMSGRLRSQYKTVAKQYMWWMIGWLSALLLRALEIWTRTSIQIRCWNLIR